MRILHCCLSCFYIDGYGYQENILPIMNQNDGHEVMIVASTETYSGTELVYLQPRSYKTETGIPIIRLPYNSRIPHFIGTKIRAYIGLQEVLDNFQPDVIMFHGVCAYEIQRVAAYKRKHTRTRLYCDSHTAFYNSAQNFFSKFFLHGLLYRRWFRAAIPQFDKVFYIGPSEKDYLRYVMGLRDNQMEFYPLGGTVISELYKRQAQSEIRQLHTIPEHGVLLVHSGKLDHQKKTADLVRAFLKADQVNQYLIIIGTIADEIKEELTDLFSLSNRIHFIGWKDQNQLMKYLSAADLYVQPGSVSSTLQNAICCGTAVMVYRHAIYEMIIDGNGFFASNEEELTSILKKLDKRDPLLIMGEASYRYAKEHLDYIKLARRLYH